MSKTSAYKIREDKIKIKGKAWDDTSVKDLFMKKITQFDALLSYNQWILDRGHTYFDFYQGRIVTDEQREIYEELEDKIVIEPPIMKSPIRALVSQAMKSRRSGQVVTEGGSLDEPNRSADETEVVSIILKDMELKTKEKYRIRDAIHDSFVACYPSVLYFDKKAPSEPGDAKYKLTQLPWDSVLVGPVKYREPDGSDIREMMFFDPRTQADLEDNFPEMIEQIQAHCERGKDVDNQLISSLVQYEGIPDSAQKQKMFDIIEHSTNVLHGPSGYVPTIMHLFPIKRKEEIWVNIFDESGRDFEMRPPEWSDSRWNKWVEDNKDKYAGPYEREVVTLWITVFTLTGLVLSNERHWFQEKGRLPASFWIPAMINGLPSGPADDMADNCLANTIGVIEQLDDLRKGSGTLIGFKEGAVKNLENITEEANKNFGYFLIDKEVTAPISEVVHEIKRTPNTHWGEWAQGQTQSMYDNTRINETMQGGSAPRQAAIAKELEIAQAISVNMIYLDNVNRSWEFHQDLKCMLIPYFYDEWEVIELRDEETSQDKRVEVNKPDEFDEEGNPVSVINDLTSHKYRWRLNPVDDSSTAKIRMMEDALSVINGAMGPLLDKDPTGKMFARFMQAMPNEILKDAGRALAEDAKLQQESQSQSQQQQAAHEALIELSKAKADLLRAQKQGVSMSFKAEDLIKYPNMFQFYNQLQSTFNMTVEQQTQPAAPPQQQPQPEQQPQDPMALA